MDDLITSRYESTGRDLIEMNVAHQRYIWRESTTLRFARVFFGGLVLVSAAGWLVRRGRAATDPSTLLRDVPGLLMVLALLAYLLHPRNLLNRLFCLHSFRSLPEGSRSIEWGYDQDSLWLRTALAEAIYRWELFPTVVESPNCFLFYQKQRNLALWLPSHGFSSPGMLLGFVDLARAKVPNYVVLGPCQFPAKPEPIGLDEL